MEVIAFRTALAAPDRDEAIVIAFFDGEPVRCVCLVKGSRDAADALRKALGSALKSDVKEGAPATD